MKRIALKIDVDTYQGTLLGVPALRELLLQNGALATFFFSFGLDRSGCEKSTGSVKKFYRLKTRLNGRWLPAPLISGKQGISVMKKTAEAGFEVGIHAWDRVFWEKKIQTADNPWVEREMCKAIARFDAIFENGATDVNTESGEKNALPRAHAAAGWKTNRHALRLTQRLGYAYASDCRGSHPFIPVIDGEIVLCPQIPTTLPTLNEAMAFDPPLSPNEAANRIFQLSQEIPGDHVFTLRAELEGMAFIDTFNVLLAQWKESGVELTSLSALLATIKQKDLPRHVVGFADVLGGEGQRMTQGALYP